MSSFLSQYGLRIRTKEFETVSWDEFKALLSGLSPDTALGRIVAIRSETDKDIIKHFNQDQKKIYDEWRSRSASSMSEEDYDKQWQLGAHDSLLWREVVEIEKINAEKGPVPILRASGQCEPIGRRQMQRRLF